MSLATAPLDVTVEFGADRLCASAPGVRSELPCRTFDPDMWFSDAPTELELAKSLCGDCPLRVECLAGAAQAAPRPSP
jgi:WhiB family redox-sensing transcriptional regulator